jgi:hypothetical protein
MSRWHLIVGKGSTRPFSYTKTKMKIYSSTHFHLRMSATQQRQKTYKWGVASEDWYSNFFFMENCATLEVMRSITYSGMVYWGAQSSEGHGESRHSIRLWWVLPGPVPERNWFSHLLSGVSSLLCWFMWQAKMVAPKVKPAGSRLYQRRPEKGAWIGPALGSTWQSPYSNKADPTRRASN